MRHSTHTAVAILALVLLSGLAFADEMGSVPAGRRTYPLSSYNLRRNPRLPYSAAAQGRLSG